MKIGWLAVATILGAFSVGLLEAEIEGAPDRERIDRMRALEPYILARSSGKAIDAGKHERGPSGPSCPPGWCARVASQTRRPWGTWAIGR